MRKIIFESEYQTRFERGELREVNQTRLRVYTIHIVKTIMIGYYM
jgi:hypothetical protein